MFRKYKRVELISFLAPFAIFSLFLLYYAYISILSSSVPLSNGCDQSHASFIQDPTMDTRRVSFCSQQDKDEISIESNYFPITKYLSFDYIGNPNGPDTSVYLEDKYQNKYIIPNLRMRGDGWTHKTITVPSSLKKEIRIVADDTSIVTNGWVGLGNVIGENSMIAINLPVYIKTMAYIFIFSLFISVIFAYFSTSNDPLEAFIYTSLFFGITSLMIFYTYLWSVELGKIMSLVVYGLVLGGLILIKKEFFKQSFLLFSVLASMMTVILFLAYINIENIENLQSISADRWHSLPVDNWIPKFFADAILRADIPSPLFGDWLSSDRSPLQTGFFLIFTYIDPGHVSYLVHAVGMQLLVIIFVVLFIKKYIKDNNFIFFVTILLFFNGFVFVHSLFVWPKLLSALYQGIAFYYLYTLWVSDVDDRKGKNYILFGVFSALAFLSHGGSIFYLLAIALLLLFTLKHRDDIGKLLYGLLSSIILYVPWVIYQKLFDPPGDRLLKWHLAGQVPVTDKSFLEVFIAYYENLTFSHWIEVQFSHIIRMYDSFYFDIFSLASLTRDQFLGYSFFCMNYSFLFFSIFLAFLYWCAKKQSYQIKTGVTP